MRIFRFLCCVLAALLTGGLAVQAAAKRVLFLGDSMSMGAFGTTLDQRLRDAGLTVYTDVTGGATPYYWLREFESISCDIGHWMKTPRKERRVKVIAAVPKVEDLMETYNPEIVVVQTGANLYATLNSKRKTTAEAQAEVESLVEKMCQAATAKGRRLYWITPPDSHPQRFSRELQERMRGIMKRIAGKYGRVFDSYAVTKFTDPYPGTDGIHYGAEEASAWAEKVAADVVAFAATGKGRGSALETAPKAIPKEKKAAEAPKKAESDPDKIEVRRAKVVREQPDNAVTVEIRLARKSEFATPSQITYNSAFAIYEYEVVKVYHGAYSENRMRVAHPVVWGRKIQKCRDWQLGKSLIVELVPLSNYPSLDNTVQKIDELPDNRDLDIYIPKM